MTLDAGRWAAAARESAPNNRNQPEPCQICGNTWHGYPTVDIDGHVRCPSEWGIPDNWAGELPRWNHERSSTNREAS